MLPPALRSDLRDALARSKPSTFGRYRHSIELANENLREDDSVVAAATAVVRLPSGRGAPALVLATAAALVVAAHERTGLAGSIPYLNTIPWRDVVSVESPHRYTLDVRLDGRSLSLEGLSDIGQRWVTDTITQLAGTGSGPDDDEASYSAGQGRGPWAGPPVDETVATRITQAVGGSGLRPDLLTSLARAARPDTFQRRPRDVYLEPHHVWAYRTLDSRLHGGERVLAAGTCSFARSGYSPIGHIVVTDQRALFAGAITDPKRRLTSHMVTELPIAEIVRITTRATSLQGGQLRLDSPGGKFHVKWLSQPNLDWLTRVLQALHDGAAPAGVSGEDSPPLNRSSHIPQRNVGGPDSSQAPAAALDTVEAIRQFARLRDEGLITDADFNAKKSQLLDRRA